MMVLIEGKFNKEQLLLETFFPKMHIDRDICKKVISRGLKPQKKLEVGGRGFNMLFITSFSEHFPHFCWLILQFFSSFA